jgi:hypothetical protein
MQQTGSVVDSIGRVAYHRLVDPAGNSFRLKKFQTYFQQRNEYAMFVGVPLSKPTGWERVIPLEGDVFCGVNLRRYKIEEIKSWVVAYANSGEIVDSEGLFYPLPIVVKSIMVQRDSHMPEFSPEDLGRGLRKVRIEYGPSPTHPEKSDRYYSTRLTNISNERIRCLSFGGFERKGERFKLANVTRSLYSASQFEDWYAVQRGGWIEPKESVCDPSNYGGGANTYWVYYFETDQNRRFHAGANQTKPCGLRRLLAFLKFG